jgi:hypothetical protein
MGSKGEGDAGYGPKPEAGTLGCIGPWQPCRLNARNPGCGLQAIRVAWLRLGVVMRSGGKRNNSFPRLTRGPTPAPISICSFCSSCIGASYLPSTTDYEIAIVESRRGGVCYARHIPRARARSST